PVPHRHLHGLPRADGLRGAGRDRDRARRVALAADAARLQGPRRVVLHDRARRHRQRRERRAGPARPAHHRASDDAEQSVAPHPGRAKDVKPAKFEYHAPSTLDEAIALLVRYGGDAKVLAGGQSLVPLLNFRLARPAALVDLNRIRALAYIRDENGLVRLAADEVLTEVRLPAMPEGAGWAFEEFARRHGDFAIVGVAAALWRGGGRVTARLATAGAGPVPRRLSECEQILERDGLGDAAIE